MKKTLKNRTQKLTVAVAMALTLPVFARPPVYAADDFDARVVTVGDKPFAQVYTYSTDYNGSLASSYDLLGDKYAFIAQGLDKAIGYWGDLLVPQAKNEVPWQIVFHSIDAASASAGTYNRLNGDMVSRNLWADHLQTGQPKLAKDVAIQTAPTMSFTVISVGKYLGAGDDSNLGWHLDGKSVLPTGDEKADLVTTFRHELGHSLGISDSFDPGLFAGAYNVQGYEDVVPLNTNFAIRNYRVPDEANVWMEHLVDQNGRHLADSKYLTDSKGKERLQEMYPKLQDKDFFVVDNLAFYPVSDEVNAKNYPYGDKQAAEADGYAYFVGDHVIEVLDGKAYQTSAGDKISGLPVNSWEQERMIGYQVLYQFAGSHVQLPGVMNHKIYSNYATLMEAELAVMQDLGYNLDRKAYYGRSIYNDDQTLTNTQGYFARNAEGTGYLEGTYSKVPLGVGLHVFGARNNITQAGDIMTAGDGAVGIRMDGVDNKLTIAKDTKVQADGERGMGLLVAYGRNHEVNLDGTVTANGKDGNAVQFDFGSSMRGVFDDYRGSYIRSTFATGGMPGHIMSTTNNELASTTFRGNYDELMDELIDEYYAMQEDQDDTRLGFLKEDMSAALQGIVFSQADAEQAKAGLKNNEVLWNELKSIIVDLGPEMLIADDDDKYFIYTYKDKLSMPNKNVWNYEADELRGALVNDFNVHGTISGAKHAIYISKNAFVKNINILDGAKIHGDITSDWRDFSAGNFADSEGTNVKVQYKGNAYDYDEYVPDLVTNLNFSNSQDMSYDGNITGKNNMKMNVKRGTLTYGGTADVVNVKVAAGATLLGGTYMLNDQTEALAKTNASAHKANATTFTDDETGQLIAGGTIGASSDDSNMTISGTLVLQDGATLVGYASGGADKGIIQNLAKTDDVIALSNVKVKLLNAVPGDKKNVLKTNAKLQHKLVNHNEDTAMAQSALLNVYGYTDGDALIGVAVAANNMQDATDEQQSTIDSLNRMAGRYQGSGKADVLRPVYNQNEANTKAMLGRIAGNTVLDTSIRLAQQSTLTHDAVAERLHGYGWKQDNVSLGDNLWMKMGKSWGDLRGDSDYHGSSVIAGYDWRNVAGSREGFFVAHNTASLANHSDSAKLQDTRVGYYSGRQIGPASLLLYGDLGYERTRTKRYLYEGVRAEGKPESYLAEVGAEYAYDLHHDDNKTWHVQPYGGLTASVLHQREYAESGAGIVGQRVDDQWNTYVAASSGVQLSRALPGGGYGFRLGVRQSLSGASPDFGVQYVGDDAVHTITRKQDRTHVVASVQADSEFAKGWHVQAQASAECGAHDKGFSAALQLKRTW